VVVLIPEGPETAANVSRDASGVTRVKGSSKARWHRIELEGPRTSFIRMGKKCHCLGWKLGGTIPTGAIFCCPDVSERWAGGHGTMILLGVEPERSRRGKWLGWRSPVDSARQ